MTETDFDISEVIPDLTQHQLDRGAIRSMATRAVLEKTDRLLGWDGRVVINRPQKVNESATSGWAPAWTNGKTITINGRQDPLREALVHGFTPRTMMLVTALNYHELAHCFFTPRLQHPFVTHIRNMGWFMSLNALEDQSAESKFVRLYRPAAAYFTTIISQLMLESDDPDFKRKMLQSNYPLIAGRKFLPADIRRMFRENFVRPDVIPDFERIIDEYCDLVFPDDMDRMTDLVEEYHNLLKQALGEHPGAFSQHPESSEEGLVEGDLMDPDDVRRVVEIAPVGEDISDEPLPTKGQSDATQDDQEQEEKAESGSSGEGEEDEDEEKGSSASQDRSDDENDDEPKVASQGGQGDAEDGSESDENEPDDQDGLPGGHRGGRFKGKAAKHEPVDLDERLRDAIQDSLEDVKDELEERTKSVRSAERSYQVSMEDCQYRSRTTESFHHTISRQVEKHFRRLNQKYRPGWYRQQESGKLNTNDLSRIKRGRTDVFKRWNQGVNNALAFEVVLLLDQSGSMSTYVKESCDALWILHRAMKRLDTEVTVLGYSNYQECAVVMQRGTETPSDVRDYYTGGATYVAPALEETDRIFKVSRKPMKLCVIITDGGFSDPDHVRDWLHNQPNPVAIVGIGYDVSSGWDPERFRSLKVSKTIQTPMDLVPLVQNLVTKLARERYDK